MDVSISIVNYNSSDLVLKAIESVVQFTTGVSYEIIVVNNSPGDEGYYKIKEKYPSIFLQTIDLGDNYGFSKANNEAFRVARGEYFLTFNPDLFLRENSIFTCWQYLESHQDYVAATVKFVYPDGRWQPSAFYKQKGAVIFYGNIPYGTLLSKRVIKTNKPFPPQEPDIVDVDVLCGAFIMAKSSIYKEIKGFDEDFFLYGEDWEISNRLGLKGKLALLNHTSVVHMHGGTSEREFEEEGSDIQPHSKKWAQMFLSILLWQKKEFGKMIAIKLYLKMLLGGLFMILGIIKKRGSKKSINATKLYFLNLMTIFNKLVLILRDKKNTYKII